MTAGRAHGAVTVLNATATGHGCSLALRDGVTAEWTWTDGDGLDWTGPTDDRLAQACLRLLAPRAGCSGATARTQSPWPPSRGLKTSSGAATALIRAAAADAGIEFADDEVERLGVQASRDAGVTLTGALDDQVATVRGGCHLTDNAAGTVLEAVPVQSWHVAVWVPEVAISKSDVARLDPSRLAPHVHAAEALLRGGDVPGAMTHNGAVYLGFYESLGLPVRIDPVRVALEHGALGAGLSGTGPAVAALFDDRTHLPPVPGGTWRHSRVQEAA